MRLTYTDLKTQFLNNIGSPGSTDTNILSNFNAFLGTRYQDIFAEFKNYQTVLTQTAATVATQQYYHNPPGYVNIESVKVTTSSSSTITYPLKAINSSLEWDFLNAIQFSGSAIPQYFFQRRDDFGLWPIPQDSTGVITINYTYRDRNLSQADYTTATVTATNNSQTITGSGTTFTSAMIGRWFQLTSQDGYWYRVSAVASATSLTLESAFQGATASGVTYRIGETPELPEDAHVLLLYGVLSDFFGGPRQDVAKATFWNNYYWTGDPNNNDRSSRDIKGGLIGIKRRYSSRSESRIIRHNQTRDLAASKLFAQTLSL